MRRPALGLQLNRSKRSSGASVETLGLHLGRKGGIVTEPAGGPKTLTVIV